MPQPLTLPIDANNSVVSETVKVTTGYFTGGAGKLTADSIYTGSLADGNEKYYFNIGKFCIVSRLCTIICFTRSCYYRRFNW